MDTNPNKLLERLEQQEKQLLLYQNKLRGKSSNIELMHGKGVFLTHSDYETIDLTFYL